MVYNKGIHKQKGYIMDNTQLIRLIKFNWFRSRSYYTESLQDYAKRKGYHI